MFAAIEARAKGGLDVHSAACIYALCEAHGVTVRFNDINMEGMYDRIPKPRIHLSALRPLGRRAFNCAHELGHHVFGHGSTIDELRDEVAGFRTTDPDEFLVDAFAGFVLMPTLGVRYAFAARGWEPSSATPAQMFVVACSFGVGYATLVSHLAYGIKEISRDRAAVLLKATPKSLRRELLGDASSEPLIVLDAFSCSRTIDAEVGTQLLLPPGATPMTDVVLTPIGDRSDGGLFRASRAGIVRVADPAKSWAAFVRVSRAEYVGLARFRHLEEDPSDVA
jgi:hypothetical protein